MKRFLAVLAVLCCLLLILPTAFAEPAEEEPVAIEEETPEEPEEVPEEAPVPEIDPLSGETAIRTVRITVVMDEKGVAAVTQELEMSIVGAPEELRFAVPEAAKNREVMGYRVKSAVENGLRYLTVKSKTGFTGNQTFTITYTQDGLISEGEESQKLELPLLVAQVVSSVDSKGTHLLGIPLFKEEHEWALVVQLVLWDEPLAELQQETVRL